VRDTPTLCCAPPPSISDVGLIQYRSQAASFTACCLNTAASVARPNWWIAIFLEMSFHRSGKQLKKEKNSLEKKRGCSGWLCWVGFHGVLGLCPSPTRQLFWSWLSCLEWCVLMCQSNPKGHFSWVVQWWLMSQSIGVIWSADQSCSGFSTPELYELWGMVLYLTSCTISDRSCLVFSLVFLINRANSLLLINFGKCKLSSSI
jgi:hypothetical protein